MVGTNSAIPVYKHGLSDGDMDILQVGLSKEDRISQFVVDILQDSHE